MAASKFPFISSASASTPGIKILAAVRLPSFEITFICLISELISAIPVVLSYAISKLRALSAPPVTLKFPLASFIIL